MVLAALLILIIIGQAKTEVLCNGSKPVQLPNGSAAGRWYLTYATKMGGSKEKYNSCGFFNTLMPCKCIGVDVNTTMTSPKIIEYTLQNFGYNLEFNSLATTEITFNMDNNTMQSAIFNASVPLAKVAFPIALVGTDNYSSWISLVMCQGIKDSEGNKIIPTWIITRSPVPSASVVKDALQAIASNTHQDPSNLTQVNQTECPLSF